MGRKNLRDRLYLATFSDHAPALAREYGIALELDHTCISDALSPSNRQSLLTSIRQDLDTAGTARCIMHGPFTEVYPAAIDPLALEVARTRLSQAGEVAAEVGASAMVAHTGYVPFIYFPSWQVERSLAFWPVFLADKPADFSLYLENVLEPAPDMLREMMASMPDRRVRLCLDTGHALCAMEGDSPAEKARRLLDVWLPALAPYIGHLHLHSNDGYHDQHGALGTGCLDVDALLEAAEALCGAPTYTVEALDGAASLAWLRRRGYI